jgi:hypothetical protein
VILGEQLDRAAAQPINAAIADMGKVDLLSGDRHGGDRGA